MQILVSGLSGLVGQALKTRLQAAGHSVRGLSRQANPAQQVFAWDPKHRQIDQQAFVGLDAVIHLAGENIAGARWTPDVKQRIRDSRVQGTRFLCETLAHSSQPPKTFLCASATGYYGDRGDELLTEASPPGKGFLPEVSVEWEAACQPVKAIGMRVVNVRTGMVLSRQGGALAKMLPLFRWGMGGILGTGDQFWSWITLTDLVSVIVRCLEDTTFSGPVNAVAPQPVTNREFTKELARAVHRPALVPAPKFLLRLAIGEMADDLLLASTRAVPQKLQQADFVFEQPNLAGALQHEIG